MYFKYLDFPEYTQDVQDRFVAYLKTAPDIYHRRLGVSLMLLGKERIEERFPEIRDLFKPYNLVPEKYMVFVVWKPTDCGIHADDWPQVARINLPVLNCQGTRTLFYGDHEMITVDRPGGSKVHLAKRQNLAPVEAANSNRPLLLKVQTLHKVDLPQHNPVPRITLSISFEVDPAYLFDVL